MAEAANQLPEKPLDRLDVIYKGAPLEIFMSFMRLNKLLRIIEGPQDVVMLALNPDASEMIIKVLVCPVKERFDLIEIEETDVGQEDYEIMLSWVQDHLTYFFMKQFQAASAKGNALEPLAKGLLSSSVGSEN